MTFQNSILPRAVVFGLAASAVLAAPLPHVHNYDNDLRSQPNIVNIPYRSFLPSNFKSYGDWAIAEMNVPGHGLDSDNEPQGKSWRAMKNLLEGVVRSNP